MEIFGQFLNLFLELLILNVYIRNGCNIIKIDLAFLGNLVPFLLEGIETLSQLILDEEVPDEVINQFLSGYSLSFWFSFEVDLNYIVFLDVYNKLKKV
jgi:hypothetical protein